MKQLNDLSDEIMNTSIKVKMEYENEEKII